MVRQLELAIKKTEALSDTDQEVIAAIVEAELADGDRWQRRFEETSKGSHSDEGPLVDSL